ARLDLHLLIHAPLRFRDGAFARDDQLAPGDLERHRVGVDTGELGDDDGARRTLIAVIDVDPGREPGLPGAMNARPAALGEWLAQELVHLAEDALEVQQQ